MKITFANKASLEVDIFGTDMHDNLIIELKTEEYSKTKKILFNKNATAKITDGENTYTGYTVVRSFTSDVDDFGHTQIKAFLIRGGEE